MKFIRTIAAFTAAMLIVFSTINAVPLSAAVQDFEGNWASGAIQKWLSRGLIKGYPNGDFKPDTSITRAEFITLIDKILKLPGRYTEDSFVDVAKGAWYAETIEKAKSSGIVEGNGGKFYPDNSITRQEAAVIICKIFDLKASDKNIAHKFLDGKNIDDWALDAVSALVEGGYVSGRENNLFAPTSNITRAESVYLLDKIVGELKDKSGTYSEEIKSNIVVNSADVVLKDMTIDGDLLLAQGIGNGDVTLDNIIVKGRTIIRGGGENSIYIKNSILSGTLVVLKDDGKIRIVASGNSVVDNVQLKSGVKLQEENLSGDGFKNILIDNVYLENSTVELNGNYSEVMVKVPVNIKIVSGKIDNIKVIADGTRINMAEGVEVALMIADSPLYVTGKGKIMTAKINSKNVRIETAPARVEYGEGISAPITEPTPSPSESEPTSSENPELVPTLTGFTWEPGSVICTTKATSIPEKTLKYLVGTSGVKTHPKIGDEAVEYKTPLLVNVDIGVTSDQHIFIVAVDENNKITGWADIEAVGENINFSALQIPTLTQSVIDAAISEPLDYFDTTSHPGWSDSDNRSSKALYYLTLAAHLDASAKSTGNILASERVLEHIRNLISGGKEPFCCNGPYWSHAVVSQSFLLAKNTPVIWDALTELEKSKIDWLMKGLAITGNWGFNDQNDYYTGFDLTGNFEKSWNPNHRWSYLPSVLAGGLYFGIDEMNQIFTDFDYDTYIAKFTEYGFTNIIFTWSKAGKDLMENGGPAIYNGDVPGGTGKGVKIPFTYNNRPLSDIIGILEDLVAYTYGATVIDSYADPNNPAIKGNIISGASSPYLGQYGMMLEFAAGDAAGLRSDALYCYDSMQVAIPTILNMQLLDKWGQGSQQKNMENLINVGTEDLIFKLQNGYHSYSKGVTNDYYEYSAPAKKGYLYDKDMWYRVIKLSSEETTIAIPPARPMPKPIAPPEGAWQSLAISDTPIPDEALIDLGVYSAQATMEFDVTFNNLVDNTFNGVLAFADKDATNLDFANINMLLQFINGTINIRNGGSYVNTSLKASAYYKYHFRIVADTNSKKYSVWATPIIPQSGSEILVANNFDFRAGALPIDNIGKIIAETQTQPGLFWVENFTFNSQLVQITPDPTPQEGVVTLEPTSDAFVQYGKNDINFGDSKILEIKDSPNPINTRRIYLKFDLSSISTASNVKLKIHGYGTDAKAVNVNAYGVSDNSWIENGVEGITWSNAPQKTTAVLDLVAVNNVKQYFEFDVTDYVKEQLLAGNKEVSFVLQCDNKEDLWLAFSSKEADDNHPQLIVTQQASSSLAPVLPGFAWATGSVTGTTKAALIPTGILKYIVGEDGAQTRPNIGDSSTSYSHMLAVNTDIPVISGQHIFIVSVDENGSITGWRDVAVTDANIKQAAEPAQDLAGFTWSKGSVFGTTVATAVPEGTLKFVISAEGAYTRPQKEDLAFSYTNTLTMGNDISVTQGQHIFIVSLNENGKINGWIDIEVANENINTTTPPTLSGFLWAPGSEVGTTRAIAIPTGILKYLIGEADTQTRPNMGDLAANFTNTLAINTDIAVASGQHIFVVSVDESDKVSGWSDIPIIDSNIRTTSSAISLNPIEDAHTHSKTANKDANFASQAYLEINDNSNPENNRKSYLKFDISAAKTVSSAKLRIYLMYALNADVEINAFSINPSDWTETDITWNNAPTEGEKVSSMMVNGVQYYELDITSYIQSQLTAGEEVISLVIECNNKENKWLAFSSREASTNKPELVISP